MTQPFRVLLRLSRGLLLATGIFSGIVRMKRAFQ
jgi:hypothetical protein